MLFARSDWLLKLGIVSAIKRIYLYCTASSFVLFTSWAVFPFKSPLRFIFVETWQRDFNRSLGSCYFPFSHWYGSLAVIRLGRVRLKNRTFYKLKHSYFELLSFGASWRFTEVFAIASLDPTHYRIKADVAFADYLALSRDRAILGAIFTTFTRNLCVGDVIRKMVYL